MLSGACATHIAPYKPKHRKLDPGAYAAAPAPAGASLYAEGQGGLFDDERARRVGDIIVVRIDESDEASRDDSTDLQRKSSTSYSIPGSFGLLGALQKAHPGIDPAALLNAESESSFNGGGKIARKGRLVATLPVRVQRLLPNGDLYIEGTKVVLIGQEEQHLYVSGIVRAADVRPDDSVLSSRIADAEIEVTGRGDVSAQQRRGWLARTFDKVWPF